MNDQMQENFEMKPKKKKFYQKWWFWVIVGFLGISMMVGILDDGESDTEYVGTETQAQTQMDEAEYKSSCKTYTYKELARNPENYKGEKITLKGEVIQVLESGKKVEMRININGDYDQTVYVMYTLKSDEGRILENDKVKVYGTFEGLLTYKSVLGAEITLPRIDAKYIELVG